MHSQRLTYQRSNASVNKIVVSRTPLRMVKSTFQPPQQTQATYQYTSESQTLNHQKLNHPSRFSKLSLQQNNQHQYPMTPDSNYDIQKQEFHPNIEFIKSLRPIHDRIEFEEGDCFPLDTDDRWLILSGEIKVIGVNGLSFQKKTGFIFFSSLETKRRIKEVVALSSTVACKIPQQFFRDYVRNFLYVKNAQKIKYMKYSPFLVWNQSISEDLAICMDLIEDLPKDVEIYQAGAEAQYLYFVKEGIILLERLGKAGNTVIQNYEKHYESTYLNEEEGLLIVRKGMIFGVDGILIKEKNEEINLLNHESVLDNRSSDPNPENVRPYQQIHPSKSKQQLKNNRIYTAKAIGKCELFRLQKSVLQAYFKMSEYLDQHPQELHMSKQELDRISLEYTNLIMGSKKMSQLVRKKQFKFDYHPKEDQQQEKKKLKVKEIKQNEKKMKRVSQNNLISQDKSQHYDNSNKEIDEYENLIKRTQIFRRKKSKSPKKQNPKSKQQSSLPSLRRGPQSQNTKLQGLIMKRVQQKDLQEYLSYKRKIQKSLLQKEVEQKKPLNMQCMKVKSYRNILSSLG